MATRNITSVNFTQLEYLLKYCMAWRVFSVENEGEDTWPFTGSDQQYFFNLDTTNHILKLYNTTAAQDSPIFTVKQFDGSYNSLSDKPRFLNAISYKSEDYAYEFSWNDNAKYSIYQADWNAQEGSGAFIRNKPTIPAAQVNSDWNATEGVAQILNKPTIPAAQVNSDWNAAAGVAQILNKPDLSDMATKTWVGSQGFSKFSGNYEDLTNRPLIPYCWIDNGYLYINSNTDSSDSGEELVIPIVQPNPIGSASEVLNTVRIGETIFSLPSGGGGGGTSDYTQLSNKPQINGTTLSGNKTLSDLGIQPTTGNATQSVAGLMSATDKTKLDQLNTVQLNDVVNFDNTTTSSYPFSTLAQYSWICIYGYKYGASNAYGTLVFSPSMIKACAVSGDFTVAVFFGTINWTGGITLHYTDDNSPITWVASEYGDNTQFVGTRIVGIK